MNIRWPNGEETREMQSEVCLICLIYRRRFFFSAEEPAHDKQVPKKTSEELSARVSRSNIFESMKCKESSKLGVDGESKCGDEPGNEFRS